MKKKILHCIIISGTDTKSTPLEIPELNTQLLLQNPNLIHWHAQNYDGSVAHPKLSAVPLGPNFHSLDPDSGEYHFAWINRKGKNKTSTYMAHNKP